MGSRVEVTPNVACTGNHQTLRCYVCERELPRKRFLVTSSTDVCIDCRRSRAYQEIHALKDFTRWCPECGSYEPIQSFWYSEKMGFSRMCGKHESEAKAKKRKEDPNADGYRVRWMRNLRKAATCTSCDSTQNLNFVHLRPEERLFRISQGVNNRSVAEIQEELRKCEVWCDTCMHDILPSETYKKGLLRKTSSVDWDSLFALVDALMVIEDRETG